MSSTTKQLRRAFKLEAWLPAEFLGGATKCRSITTSAFLRGAHRPHKAHLITGGGDRYSLNYQQYIQLNEHVPFCEVSAELWSTDFKVIL